MTQEKNRESEVLNTDISDCLSDRFCKTIRVFRITLSSGQIEGRCLEDYTECSGDAQTTLQNVEKRPSASFSRDAAARSSHWALTNSLASHASQIRRCGRRSRGRPSANVRLLIHRAVRLAAAFRKASLNILGTMLRYLSTSSYASRRSRLSNFANRSWKNNSFFPMGPLRCLLTIMSAIPLRSEFGSYTSSR